MNKALDDRLPVQRRAWRVLVVDDDAISAAVQSQMLQLMGYEASTETDSRRAIERASAEPFDLVLVDLSMPSMNGFEVLRRLRSLEGQAQRPPLPMIAVTGMTSPESRARCLAAGFADHLSKPVLLSKLQEAIERVLDFATAPGTISARKTQAGDVVQLRATVQRLETMTPVKERFSPTVTEAFALRSAQLIDSLQRAIDNADRLQAVRHAQALDTNAQFLGASRLSAGAAALARHCEAGDWPQARQRLIEFEQQHQAVLTVLFQIDR